MSEYNGIRLGDNPLLVGTITKRAAVKIHSELINGKSLTLRKRKIMTNGLSSILDISDNSFASQRSLFKEDEWEYIANYFSSKLNIILDLNSKLADSGIIISSTLGLSGDFDCCQELLRKEIALANKIDTVIGLKVLDQVLRIMENYQYMLSKVQTKKVTEDDYLRYIWSPIFETIFPPKDNRIRIKSGESISPASSSNKTEQYHSSKFVKSLKVDFRLLIDLNDGEEIDVAAGECALYDNDDKSISDEGKLTREAKDALDRIIKMVPEDLKSATCWSI